jgi:D-alanine-D-alanine ligase
MNQKYRHVAVLLGGTSSERAVSLRSGAAVARGLRAAGYRVTEVDVQGPDLALPGDADAVFIVLHGTFGEDGTLQALLEERRIPYTGPGVQASRLAFDKVLSKRTLERRGIATPRYEVLRPGGMPALPVPAVVKPPREGSSVGVTRVTHVSQWAEALEKVYALGQEALVEAFVPGRELTVGIVGDQVLPVVEIRAPDGDYDYRAKYTAGVTEYLAPAPLTADQTRRCQEVAWAVFQALGARGVGRVDIRLSPEDEPFVLELNTIPGFTETSLLPQGGPLRGHRVPELCERILNLACAGRRGLIKRPLSTTEWRFMWYLDGDRQDRRGNKWGVGGRGPILKVRARVAAGGTDRAHRIAAIAILLIALAGLGVGVALGFRQLGAWLFASNPRYVIQPGGLDLQSSGRLQPAHLRDYAGLAEGQNLFALDLGQIRKSLLSVPLIKSADVRRVLPGTLRVRVSERVPVARLASGAGFQFAVDRDGVVLGPSGRAATLPLITGVTEPGLSPARRSRRRPSSMRSKRWNSRSPPASVASSASRGSTSRTMSTWTCC